jgi:hypothetical protein
VNACEGARKCAVMVYVLGTARFAAHGLASPRLYCSRRLLFPAEGLGEVWLLISSLSKQA